MTAEIFKIAEDFIEQVKNKAKETSIENLKLILTEIERNPERSIYDDLNIIYIIYKKELELRITV